MSLLTLLGLIGAGCIILAYGLLQVGRLSQHTYRYQFLNLAGTFLILSSLYEEWNLPAFVIEVFWLGITLLGLLRVRRVRQQNHAQ